MMTAAAHFSAMPTTPHEITCTMQVRPLPQLLKHRLHSLGNGSRSELRFHTCWQSTISRAAHQSNTTKTLLKRRPWTCSFTAHDIADPKRWVWSHANSSRHVPWYLASTGRHNGLILKKLGVKSSKQKPETHKARCIALRTAWHLAR